MINISPQDEAKAILIYNIPITISANQLIIKFKVFGKIKHTEKFRSDLGMIIFEEASMAQEAIRQYKSTRLLEENIIVTHVSNQSQFESMHNLLLIQDIPNKLDVAQLESYLNSRFGEVLFLSINLDKRYNHKEIFGFLKFVNEDSYESILKYQKEQMQEKIKIPKSSKSIKVVPFQQTRDETSKYSMKIDYLFNANVHEADKPALEAATLEYFLQIQRDSQCFSLFYPNLKFHLQYEKEINNFSAVIEFFPISLQAEHKILSQLSDSIIRPYNIPPLAMSFISPLHDGQQVKNFFKYFKYLNSKQKANYIDIVANCLKSQKDVFDNIKDKVAFLNEIFLYKFNNFPMIFNPSKFKQFKGKTDQEAMNELLLFKENATDIITMLTDTDVLDFDDIIKIASDDNELFERCFEAMELLRSASTEDSSETSL